MLAIKLFIKDKKYLDIIEEIIKLDADLESKDKFGWTIFDEAMLSQDSNLIRILFVAMYKQKRQQWFQSIPIMIQALKKAPNFYLEMNW